MTEPLSPSADDPLGLLGSVVGEKYIIERFVAEGGFSLLYRAQHTIWKQPVAVKFLKAMALAPPAQRQGLLDSFVQEGQLLRQLSSRTASILQAHDVGTWVGPAGEWYPYLILEWLDGQPLDQVLDDRRAQGEPFSLSHILSTLGSVARALEVVHRRGVAHRDIKPANLFVIGNLHGEDAFVKVLDFGIAKVIGDMAEMSAANARTGNSVSSFTPWYGAPEQFSKRYGATGPWTDVFALALVMVEMLTLRPPLDGDDLVQLAVQSSDPNRRPTPRNLGVAVSAEVEAVFARALAVEPTARYSTLGPFWNDLCHAAGADQYADQATQSIEISRLSLLKSAGLDPNILASLGASGSLPTGSLPPRETPAGGRVVITPPRDSGAILPARQGTNPDLGPSSGGPVSQRALPDLGPPSGSMPTVGTSRTSEPSITNLAQSMNDASSPGSQARPVIEAVPVSTRAPRSRLLLGGALAGVAALVVGAIAMRPGSSGGVMPAPSADPPVTPGASARASDGSCPDGMASIPGGEFYMGFDGKDAFPSEQPQHSVKLAPFCIDVTEVTVEAYRACSDEGRCPRAGTTVSWPGISDAQRAAYGPLCTIDDPGRDKHPINCVDWEMADNFCKRQNKRLPTSAEWEFAVRGPDGRTFPWGDEPPSANRLNACGRECLEWARRNNLRSEVTAMYDEDDGFPNTSPVGSFPKGRSRYGLDDVIGNVMEWVHDWDGPYAKEASSNPQGPASGTERVIRGGAWNAGQMFWVRPSYRFRFDPAARSYGIGFRCAR